MKVNTVKGMHHSDIKKHLKFLREVKRDLKRNPKHKVPKHPFKNKYREALDTITTDSSVINAIVTEANYAFRLNMYMFDEIKSTDPYPAMTAIKGFWKFLLGTINK